MNCELVQLEDEKYYLILKEQVIDGYNYLYLVNVNDEKDFAIRKEVEGYLEGLTEDEFTKALKILTENNDNKE